MNPGLPYRPNVCMFVLNADDNVFVGERSDRNGAWQLPQGGVEPEITLEENVVKELSEELGAPKETFIILKRLSATHMYDFITTPPYAVGIWRGQVQTFWLVRYRGRQEQINVLSDAAEFQSYAWIPLEELSKTVESHRFEGYKKALPEIELYLKHS